VPTVSLDELVETVPGDDSPEDRLDDRDRNNLVEHVLYTLPEKERTTITLYYISDFSQKEVAAYLDVPITTVNDRLRSARKKLKERILDMVEDTLHEQAPSRDDAFVNKIGMVNAVKAGDAGRVKYIIEQQPDLASQDINERRPIHYAAIHGHTDLVGLLLDAGADPTVGFYPDRTTTSALEMARERGYDEIVEIIQVHLKDAFEYCEIRSAIFDFIEEERFDQFVAYLKVDPASARCAEADGTTPLHYVAQHQRVRMVQPLIEYGADIDAANVRGARPIHLALEYGNHIMVGLLIGKGAEYELGVAAACGDTKFVRTALDKDPSLANWADDNGFYAITRAAEIGHVEMVRVFLEYGVTCANPLETLDTKPIFKTLSTAVDKGHLEVVRLLLDHGVDVDETKYYRTGWEYIEGGVGKTIGEPLWNAARRGHLDIANLLLERGSTPDAGIDASGCPMDCALWGDNLAMAELLIEYGAELHLVNRLRVARLRGENDHQIMKDWLEKDPEAAKHWYYFPALAAKGRADFLAYGLDLLEPSEYGKLLTWSSGDVDDISPEEGDKVAVARLLLERGADPQGHLHGFGRGTGYDRYLEIAEAIIEHGADLSARDDLMGLTPLGFAVRSNNIAYAELLLKKGASPNLPDDVPGLTPLSIAENKGFTKMMDLLEAYGAKL